MWCFANDDVDVGGAMMSLHCIGLDDDSEVAKLLEHGNCWCTPGAI